MKNNQEANMKPFSTYPEDHKKLLDLAEGVENARDDEDFRNAAYELADLVKAILTDEAVAASLDNTAAA